MLVSLPEETPVNELIETAYRFEDLVGVALAPVVVNACYPVLTHLLADPVAAAEAANVDPPGPAEAARLAAAAKFRATRQELQAVQTGAPRRRFASAAAAAAVSSSPPISVPSSSGRSPRRSGPRSTR